MIYLFLISGLFLKIDICIDDELIIIKSFPNEQQSTGLKEIRELLA